MIFLLVNNLKSQSTYIFFSISMKIFYHKSLYVWVFFLLSHNLGIMSTNSKSLKLWLAAIGCLSQDYSKFLRDLSQATELGPITCPEYGEWRVAAWASGCGKPRVPQIALAYRLQVSVVHRELFTHLLTYFDFLLFLPYCSLNYCILPWVQWRRTPLNPSLRTQEISYFLRFFWKSERKNCKLFFTLVLFRF